MVKPTWNLNLVCSEVLKHFSLGFTAFDKRDFLYAYITFLGFTVKPIRFHGWNLDFPQAYETYETYETYEIYETYETYET